MRESPPKAWLGLLLLLPAFSGDAAPNMREGMWEVTTRTEIRGGPAQMPAVRPQTMAQCFTRRDVENPQSMIPGQSGCSVQDVNATGDRVQWRMQCSSPFPMQGTGETIYSGGSFSGSSAVNTDTAGMKLELTMTYSGRRIGECQ